MKNAMNKLIISLRAFLVFSLLLGIVYPLLITGIAQTLMPFEANGSLIERNDVIVGSELIGQQFMLSKYFHSRPSAVDYNAINSGASNLAPSNPLLFKQVQKRLKSLRQENGLTVATYLPADMVLASASGLDPHISLENAKLQAPRVAKMRHISLQRLHGFILESTDYDFVGIWGRSGVNVLKLNLMLDEVTEK